MLNLQKISILALAAVFVCGGLHAQQSTGTIKGVLTDDSGAVIPAAPLVISGNGANRAAQTQADGRYTVNGLAPGQYSVKVSFPGFAPVSKVVDVTAGGTAQVPIQLQVVAEKQEVTVQAEGGPTVSVESDNNATALVLKGERPGFPARRSRRPGGRFAGAGGARCGAEWRLAVHRRVQRRAASAQGIDPRDPHQPESVFGGIRPPGFRPHRDPHQAGHGQVPRHRGIQRQRRHLQLAQSIRSPGQQAGFLEPHVHRQLRRTDQQEVVVLCGFQPPPDNGQLPGERGLPGPDDPAAAEHSRGSGHAQHAHDDRAADRLSIDHEQHADRAIRIWLERAGQQRHRPLPAARAVRGHGL